MLPAAFVLCLVEYKFVFGRARVLCVWQGAFPCFGTGGTAMSGGRDDASIVPYRWFAVFAAHSKVSPRRDEGIAPYRLVLLFVM